MVANGAEPDGTFDLLVRSAEEVAAIAPAVAIELYRRAGTMLTIEDPRRIELETACLEPMARAVGIAQARDHAEQLLATVPDMRHRRRISAALAAILATAGDLASSIDHYQAADDPAQPAPVTADDGRSPATIDDALHRCLAAGQRILLGAEPGAVAAEVRRELADGQDRAVECAAHQALALAAGATGDFDRASSHALESLRRFDPRTMSRAGFLMPDVWAASFDAFADRFDDAQTLYDRVGFEAERRGELGMLLQTTTGLGLVAFFAGRWTDASREFDLVLALGDEIGANAHKVAAHAVLAGIALGEGRDVDADVHLARGHDALRLGHHLFGVDILLWLTALRAEHAADIHAAFDGLWEFWHVSTNMRGLTQYRSFAPDLVRTAVATGHDTEATRVVTEVGALAERVGATSAAAAAHRCRALVADDPVGLVRAAELLDTTPWRFDFARTSAEASAALAAAGQHERATHDGTASISRNSNGSALSSRSMHLACSPRT